jgi:hypothetical protein
LEKKTINGSIKLLYGRETEVLARFKAELGVLRLAKDGHPSHPLYLPEKFAPFKL